MILILRGYQSLKTCLAFLQHAETPSLIRTTVPTRVRLTELTTAEGSAARFDQLCALLGDDIIGNIWIYASRDLDALQASVDAIPTIVQALGIGASRYLKVSLQKCSQTTQVSYLIH